MEIEQVKRFEYKFYITKFDYLVLRERINQVMTVDKYAKDERQYLIRSLYFDNLNNTFYTDKLDGFQYRKKIRLRMYNNDPNFIKLEIKQKEGSVIKKSSIKINQAVAEQIITDSSKMTSLLQDFTTPDEVLYAVGQEFYKPVVIVEYDREAYCLDFNNVRVTFDKNVRKQEHNFDFFNPNLYLEKPDEIEPIVLEVKFNNFLPREINNLLTFNNTQRLAISKYCLSRNLIY